jgi:hypothetical protein
VGEILLRFGLPDEAVRWFHSALRQDERYAPAHEALASYYEHIGQPGRAARHRTLAREGSGKPNAPPEKR